MAWNKRGLKMKWWERDQALLFRTYLYLSSFFIRRNVQTFYQLSIHMNIVNHNYLQSYHVFVGTCNWIFISRMFGENNTFQVLSNVKWKMSYVKCQNTNVRWAIISKTSVTDAAIAKKSLPQMRYLQILTLWTCFPCMFDISTMLKLCWNGFWAFGAISYGRF